MKVYALIEWQDHEATQILAVYAHRETAVTAGRAKFPPTITANGSVIQDDDGLGHGGHVEECEFVTT